MADPTNRPPTNRLAEPAQSPSTETLSRVEAYQTAAEPPVEFSPAAQDASSPFIGQWRTLVSTTNWEKGRIICGWRESLEQAGAGAGEHSDEAWAQLVGGVTGQHVGRLRRVYQRFGEVRTEYEGLYWSHFQTACEWDDAEMWLEGAVQNGWSVSQMRAKRWEVVGDGQTEPPAEPKAESQDEDWPGDTVAAEPNATVQPADEDPGEEASSGESLSPQAAERELEADSAEAATTEAPGTETEPPVRPFAELPELPEDIADAFEQMKLAIVRHKLAAWAEISRADLLGVLASLKQLAEAPTEE
ncbi:MAG: hypothetical protein AAGJ46_08130 [Planctomycetota bacterium]